MPKKSPKSNNVEASQQLSSEEGKRMKNAESETPTSDVGVSIEMTDISQTQFSSKEKAATTSLASKFMPAPKDLSDPNEVNMTDAEKRIYRSTTTAIPIEKMTFESFHKDIWYKAADGVIFPIFGTTLNPVGLNPEEAKKYSDIWIMKYPCAVDGLVYQEHKIIILSEATNHENARDNLTEVPIGAIPLSVRNVKMLKHGFQEKKKESKQIFIPDMFRDSDIGLSKRQGQLKRIEDNFLLEDYTQ